jgi:hypothetical protein
MGFRGGVTFPRRRFNGCRLARSLRALARPYEHGIRPRQRKIQGYSTKNGALILKGFLCAQSREENMPLFAGGVLSKAGYERDQAAPRVPCSLDTISEPYSLDAFQHGLRYRGAAAARFQSHQKID